MMIVNIRDDDSDIQPSPSQSRKRKRRDDDSEAEYTDKTTNTSPKKIKSSNIFKHKAKLRKNKDDQNNKIDDDESNLSPQTGHPKQIDSGEEKEEEKTNEEKSTQNDVKGTRSVISEKTVSHQSDDFQDIEPDESIPAAIIDQLKFKKNA